MKLFQDHAGNPKGVSAKTDTVQYTKVAIQNETILDDVPSKKC